MASLGETTARLRRREQGLGARDPSAPFMSDVPSFGANPGQLRMLSYTPPEMAPSAPLVIALHGCMQRASTFVDSCGWRKLADQCGFALVAPEQSGSNNPNRCFNWFATEDVTRGRGEAASIASMIQYALQVHRLDPNRVFITGLSAGGAMTAVMLAAYPELFAAGAVVAGLPYGAASTLSDAMRLMRRADTRTGAELGALVQNAAPRPARLPRLSVWHGDADWTVDASNGKAVAAQWASVLALSEAPNEMIEERKLQRSIWREPGREQPLIELNLVRGMGHGTPLSTAGVNDVGSTGPYMLDVGISSTLEIAKFWGLLDGRRQALDTLDDAAGSHHLPLHPERTSPFTTSGLGDQVLDAVSGHVGPKALEIIEKAFTMAGLKK